MYFSGDFAENTDDGGRSMYIVAGLFIPFAGTALGAACAFFLRNEMKPLVQKALLGFASGVMVAASVWSLLIPAMAMSERMGKMAFIPAAAGFLLGIAFLLVMDKITPHIHLRASESEGPKTTWKRTTKLVMAVTLHNIPEGMAVGVVWAGVMAGTDAMTLAGALALSVGIAIQNFPEGAIISMPLRSEGSSRWKAFAMGALSGIVEPAGAAVTIALIRYLEPLLPYFLAFAAGAMIYVVVEELIPEASEGSHSNIGTIGFAMGFVMMMILDVALG